MISTRVLVLVLDLGISFFFFPAPCSLAVQLAACSTATPHATSEIVAHVHESHRAKLAHVNRGDLLGGRQANTASPTRARLVQFEQTRLFVFNADEVIQVIKKQLARRKSLKAQKIS